MCCFNVMECDGQIKLDCVGNYKLIYLFDFILGCVFVYCDGFGFLLFDEGVDDLFLFEKEMQKVMYGDCVQVCIIGIDCCGCLEGIIVEVVECVNIYVIGCLFNENGVWVVVFEDKCIGYDVLLVGFLGKVKVGQVVSVELIEYFFCYM